MSSKNGKIIIWGGSLITIIVGVFLLLQFVYAAGERIQKIESKTEENSKEIEGLEESVENQFKKVDKRFDRQDVVLDNIWNQVIRMKN